jgi:oxygen-independent coproporphyrinogen-3 oxidase
MSVVPHLYLHLPFCRKHCPYCDYPVSTLPPNSGGWTESLRAELCMREAQGVSLSGLETVLVGGGTPSILAGEAAQSVASIVEPHELRGVPEWTIEANPEDLDPSVLEGWIDAGVNRVNIGVQSLSDSALEWLGRLHTSDVARTAMELATRSGIRSWGVDLLFGLPLDVDSDPQLSLRRVLEAQPPHVSLYELVAEPHTPIGRTVANGDVRLADDEQRADQYLALGSQLRSAGYEAYEMTAFARPGHRSRHALGVLSGSPWLGLGPGAHSCLDGENSWNLSDWRGYSRAVAEGRLPVEGCAPASFGSASAEGIWFALRQSDGLLRSGLSAAALVAADAWVSTGLAEEDPVRIRLTPEGWLRLDELSEQLARIEALEEKSPDRNLD